MLPFGKLACVSSLTLALSSPALQVSDDFDTSIREGRERMSSQQYLAAAESFERAASIRPEEPEAWFRLGLALSAAQDGDAAIAAYRKAADLDPAHAMARNNIGNVFYRRGDYQDALRWYEAALAIDPDYLLALYHRGWILRHHNRNEEAVEAFAHCLRLEPSTSREQVTKLDCLFYMGTMRFRAEDYPAAARTMEEVLKFSPGHVESLYYLGMSYRRLGRNDEARSLLEKHRSLVRERRDQTTTIERADP